MDVVIPCHPKDYEMLDLCIKHLEKNVSNLRKIYIISPHELQSNNPNFIECVHESKFPFTREDVLREMRDPGKHEIVHWYLQQLLKIYAKDVIPELSNPYLIFDADAILLKPLDLREDVLYYIHAIDEKNKYIDHAIRLIPDFKYIPHKSGVVDFQVWKKEVWNDIIEKITKKYPENPFWKTFLHTVTEIQGCGEYELYFHYYATKFPCEMREINKHNSTRVSDIDKFDYDLVCFHRWQGPRV